MAANKRLYQVWKGSNIFLCNGRLIFGPDAPWLAVSVLLLLAPAITFCIFVARNLLHKFDSYNAGYAVLAVAIVFTLYALVLLLITSASDPGIIPRNSNPLEEESYEVRTHAEGTIGGRPTPNSRSQPTLEVLVNGVPLRVKYCETCMLYRPPRCSHCSICNNCVDKFDHHCPWLGQCIGRRNYRCYLMLISSASFLSMFFIAMSALYIKYLVDDHDSVWKAIKDSPASVVVMLYCFIGLWFVGGLTGFHFYLISRNQTTYENYKYRAGGQRLNAFNLGCRNSFYQVFCTRSKPSRNKFNEVVPEEAPTIPIPATVEQSEDRRVNVGDNVVIDRRGSNDLARNLLRQNPN